MVGKKNTIIDSFSVLLLFFLTVFVVGLVMISEGVIVTLIVLFVSGAFTTLIISNIYGGVRIWKQ